MQQSHVQQQEELLSLREELQTLRQRSEKEKEEQGWQDQEVLAQLTQQAERAEDSARQLAAKLQEKVNIQRCHRSIAKCLKLMGRDWSCNLVDKITTTTTTSANNIPVPKNDPQNSL